MKTLKLLISGIALLGCTSGAVKVAAMDPLEAKGQINNGFAVLVDVREADEVKAGMAADALWMPTSKIQNNDPKWQEFKSKLPKDKTIVLYCAKGGRAAKAAEALGKDGFRTANMGGYSDWTAAKLPTKIPSAAELEL